MWYRARLGISRCGLRTQAALLPAQTRLAEKCYRVVLIYLVDKVCGGTGQRNMAGGWSWWSLSRRHAEECVKLYRQTTCPCEQQQVCCLHRQQTHAVVYSTATKLPTWPAEQEMSSAAAKLVRLLTPA